ncbi:ABC transporter permease [Marinoscillum sp.]|uniref:ABC transporter permease n=1 Tax=Marinoscillum sp. TaxID=2024838 RepID=UPI003BA87FAC
MNELALSYWQEILALSTLLQGVLLILLLAFNKYPSSRALSFVLASQCSFLCLFLLGNELSEAITGTLLLASIIAIWRYIKVFFTQNTRTSFLPFLTLLITIPLFVFSEAIGRAGVAIILSITIITFLVISNKLFVQEGKSRGISWSINPGARLSWLKWFYRYQVLTVGSGLLTLAGLLPVWSFTLTLLLEIYVILFQLVKESDFMAPLPAGTKYQKSTLTSAQKAHILNRLDALVQDKFYLESTISLSTLAESLQSTTHHLSQVLNESRRQSFQELITTYRVREAKQLLKSEQHQHTKIESIANMVGYNSKSAFNTAFKKQTGLTPSEFRESKDVLTYRDERLPDRKRRSSRSLLRDLIHGFNTTSSIMISNFIKVFIRRFNRNKLFSLINLFGLTVGFTCSILIYLFIQEHSSYDTELPDSQDIYRIAWMNDNPQTRTPHPMAPALKNDFPEVVAATSISPMYGPGLTRQAVRVENLEENIHFLERDFFYVDSTFLDVFQLEVILGDEDALSQPFNLIISESTAQRYFGDTNPIGKELTMDDWSIAVAAVVKDMPKKSHFHFTGLISYVTLKAIGPDNPWFTWKDFGHFNYIRTRKDVDYKVFESKIPKWIVEYLPWSETQKEWLLSGDAKFELQPIQDIHLQSHLRWELENNANILYIYILTGAMSFILLIVCINYINLTTAKSIERAREVGVRKTLGALSSSLTRQFYLESLVFCLIAAVLAFGLSIILLPFFNHLTQLEFTIKSLFEADFLLHTCLAVMVISLLSGLYPALVMDKFKPVDVLKGKLTASFHGRRLRNALVIFQFFVSAILIIASLIIMKQLDYMKTKELGFDQDALISIRIFPSVEIGGINVDQVRSLGTTLKNIPGVKEVSGVSNLPGGQFNQLTLFQTNQPEERIDASQLGVDYGGLEVLGLSMDQGRTFNRSMDSDTLDNHFIINQKAADQLNLDEPIGTSITWEQGGRTGQGIIVGVTRDFHFQSLHSSIQPLIMYLDPYDVNHMLVRLEGNQFQQTLNQINKVYTERIAAAPFAYEFLDSQLEELYKDEVRTLNIFTIFTSIALILACIGLLGLAIALLNQSVKEIGIRKIMGARSRDIFVMVLGQFLKLIGIALVFGLPAGYFIMQRWIQEFSYQTSIGVLPFLLSAACLSIIAILSVSVIIMKIARTNPAETLRHE